MDEYQRKLGLKLQNANDEHAFNFFLAVFSISQFSQAGFLHRMIDTKSEKRMSSFPLHKLV